MVNRARLTKAEKHAVLLECRSRGICGRRERIKEIQLWTITALKLECAPSYRTVIPILRDEVRITEWVHSNGYKRKKKHCNRNAVLDDELSAWVTKMWYRGVYLTDLVIQEKASRMQATLNMFARPTERTELKFSHGWLDFLRSATTSSVINHIMKSPTLTNKQHVSLCRVCG